MQCVYLSVTMGKIKNIQKCMPKTRITWKMTFPMTVFFRYSARSTTMVPNWISTITKKASGTWSSDNEEVISAAAECFCEENRKETEEAKLFLIKIIVIKIITFTQAYQFLLSYPKSPESKDNDNEVHSIS